MADIPTYNVNDNVTNGEGILKKILVSTSPTEDTPVYLYQANESDIKGKIYFEIRDGEYGVLGELSNFPEGYVNKLTQGFTSTSNDYPALAQEMLKKLNDELADLTDENEIAGGFGKLVLLVTNSETAKEFIEYKMIGVVVDQNNQPIAGALIKDDVTGVGMKGNNTNTEPTGDFILLGEYVKGTKFKINVSAIGYGQYNETPFELNSTTPKENVGVIVLKSLKQDLTEAIQEELPISIPQINTMQLSKMNLEMAQQQLMNKIIETIKLTLIPAALTLIAQFGISKANEMLGKKVKEMNSTCPDDLETLNKIIKKKNQLTKQLNNLYNGLKRVKVGVETADKILTIASVVSNVIGGLVLLYPAIPFSPDPTKALTTPLVPDQTGKPKSVLEKINEMLAKLKLISSSTLMVLTILLDLLQKVLSYLSLLDSLIQECAIEGALPQEQISSDLLKATQEQSKQLSPVVTNVNGFDMGVISVDGGTDSTLKRRRAVAKNQSGIIMLKGEPSFSSNDQILIDELVYYIQTNNLKAE